MTFQPHQLEHLAINIRDELDDLVGMGMIDQVSHIDLSFHQARNASESAFDQYLMWWIETRAQSYED